VAFEVDEPLTPIQLCHATRCRKASGAAYSPELLAEARGLRWRRGEARITVYEAPLLNEPPAYRRSFCSGCGSPVPTALEGTPFVLLNPGVLDDDPGTRPFRHAFVAQRAGWFPVSDDLPSFPCRPPGPDEDDADS
jgi:hypothetical protein